MVEKIHGSNILNQTIHFVRRKINSDGGAERAAKTYIEALKGLSDRVHVICEQWDGPIPPGIDVSAAVAGITRTKRVRAFQRHISNQVRTSKNTLVHSHDYTPYADVVRLGDGLHSTWLTRGDFGYFERRLDPFHRVMVELERQTFASKSLKKIVCNSEFVRNEVCDTYGIDPSRIVIIRNTLDERYIRHSPSHPDETRSILFVGSGWNRKGLDRALEALARLDQSWHLHVLGGDRDEAKYKKLARIKGVQGRVSFFGRLAVTPLTYEGYACVLHPARYEPFPNIAMECLSQGVPIVSTEDSGTSDWGVDEGVYTSPPDPDALAESIKLAAAINANQRALLREKVIRYDHQYLLDKVRDLYLSL